MKASSLAYSSYSCYSPPSSSSSACIASDYASVHPQDPSDKRKPKSKRARKNPVSEDHKPSINGDLTATGRRSSVYRGVTRHRWTGRFEAHLWDKCSWNNVQNKKGKQVYLGAYDEEEAAARTYDLAALKYWGAATILNFPIETYGKEMEEMQRASKEEYLASLRRQSSGFSRGVSKYRGVARHHHNGRWEARIGRVFGNKYLYLGTYNTQEEAAAAYDMAAIEYRGVNAVTNFDISNYIDRLKQKGIPINIFQNSLPNYSKESKLVHTQFEVHHLHHPYRHEREQEQVEQEQEQVEQEQVEQEHEEDVHQQQWKQEEEAHKVVSCLDFSSIMIPNSIDEDDFGWNFCFDSGLTSLPALDYAFESTGELLPDLFACPGFEDDVDLMFDSCFFGSEMANIGCISANIAECGVGVSRRLEGDNGKEGLLYSTSPSPYSSITASFSTLYSP